jgi:hypothetical protein
LDADIMPDDFPPDDGAPDDLPPDEEEDSVVQEDEAPPVDEKVGQFCA